MLLDGIKVRLNRQVGYRHSDPEKDFDRDGYPVHQNYLSFVRIKDCEIYEKDGKNYYNPKDAPCIPVNHGGTYYGYGKWMKRHHDLGVWVGGRLCHEYYQCTVYFARKGKVYTGSLRRTVEEHKKGFANK